MGSIWSFRALDTLFIRDGTPFHLGELGSAQPRSIFPPLMYTMQGAIRTELASRQGWKPKEPLPKELGDGDDLGDLKLQGPYLRFHGKLLFPVPTLLFGKKGDYGWEMTRLVPGKPARCDLDPNQDVCLPVLERRIDGGDLFQGWVTTKGLKKILAGGTPLDTELFQTKELWKEEIRTGIMQEHKTKIVKDGHLYAIQHIRPVEGLEILVGVNGIPEAWHPQESFGVTLGGEGRAARVNVFSQEETNELLEEISSLETVLDDFEEEEKVCFTISLITVGTYPENKIMNVIRFGPISFLQEWCVSASIGKVIQAGGWDLKKNQPRPMRPLIPAGSTWFYEIPLDQKEKVTALLKDIEANTYGMNQMVIGRWEKRGESK